jgi:amidase
MARQGVARAWSRFQTERPLVLGPVSTRSPFPVGRDLEGPDAVEEILHSLRLVVTVNLLGLPAAAVPVGISDGLPQGVQLIGPRYGESVCLEAAQAIEDQLGVITPIDPVLSGSPEPGPSDHVRLGRRPRKLDFAAGERGNGWLSTSH